MLKFPPKNLVFYHFSVSPPTVKANCVVSHGMVIFPLESLASEQLMRILASGFQRDVSQLELSVCICAL